MQTFEEINGRIRILETKQERLLSITRHLKNPFLIYDYEKCLYVEKAGKEQFYNVLADLVELYNNLSIMEIRCPENINEIRAASQYTLSMINHTKQGRMGFDETIKNIKRAMIIVNN